MNNLSCMRPAGLSLAGATAPIFLLCGARAADLPPQPPTPASAPSCFASFVDYFLARLMQRFSGSAVVGGVFG